MLFKNSTGRDGEKNDAMEKRKKENPKEESEKGRNGSEIKKCHMSGQWRQKRLSTHSLVLHNIYSTVRTHTHARKHDLSVMAS